MTPATVAGFILLDPRFARSIPHCVREIRQGVANLLGNAELRQVSFAPAALNELSELAGWNVDQVIAFGLHEYLDRVQLRLIELGVAIADTFFMARYSAA
jgi:uncharacterized alpha-E superfamily protein